MAQAWLEKLKALTLKEVESFLLDSIERFEENWCDIKYALLKLPKMGHKDEPDFDKKGKPILRRTTPLHLLARDELRTSTIDNSIARGLFEIYNKFNLNYMDEFGLTHFHVACKYGCEDVVQQFLDIGRVGPNLLVREIDDSPLLLALNWQHREVAKLLLRRGADSNLPNTNGLTPLHVTCQTNDEDGGLMRFFFHINDKLNQRVQVNAPDKWGNTPLHFAIFYGNKEKIELLLRRGASPNMRNAEESTPLHIICHGSNNYELATVFFGINKELGRTVQLDVADKWGRTPLQLAVFYLRLDLVDFLLNNGADVSSFEFPADLYFGAEVAPPNNEIRADFELGLVSRALLIVERLEKSGYRMDRSDSMMIMKLFARRGLFERSADLEKRLSDDEQFAVRANEIMVKPDLSLCDLIRLPTEEARKRVTLKEYLDFARSSKLRVKHQEACLVHLCEKLSRKFFEYWGLYPFWKLIHYRLPIICCDKIIDNLTNEDLFIICLAGQKLSPENNMKDLTAFVIKRIKD